MKLTVRMFAHGVATLDQKPRDNPVEGGAIEKFQSGKIEEVFHMSRSIVRIKADLNIPELGGDDGLWIFLFKLQWGWCCHNLGTLASGRKVHQVLCAFP